MKLCVTASDVSSMYSLYISYVHVTHQLSWGVDKNRMFCD